MKPEMKICLFLGFAMLMVTMAEANAAHQVRGPATRVMVEDGYESDDDYGVSHATRVSPCMKYCKNNHYAGGNKVGDLCKCYD